MLKVFEAFSGYGSQSLALYNVGIEFEVVGISEIDKNAIKAYYSLHNTDIENYGDISKIEIKKLPDIDLFTYSFPCLDLSSSGKMEGLKRGETRSGLLYECEKIIEGKKPKYLLLENVKNLINKRFMKDFQNWLQYLERIGYVNTWFVLNSKDFGVPQNRERVFCVSVLKEYSNELIGLYEKIEKQKQDIVDITNFLEETVSDKYDVKGFETFLKTVDEKKFNKIGAIRGRKKKGDIKNIQRLEVRNDTISNTLTSVQKDNVYITRDRIRYLTENECFKLMGLNVEEINKIQLVGIAKSQQYKLAGNSIVVPVLEAIFSGLFK